MDWDSVCCCRNDRNDSRQGAAEKEDKSRWMTNHYLCLTADKLDRYQKITDMRVANRLARPCHTPAGLVYNGLSEFIVKSALAATSSHCLFLLFSSSVSLSVCGLIIICRVGSGFFFPPGSSFYDQNKSLQLSPWIGMTSMLGKWI